MPRFRLDTITIKGNSHLMCQFGQEGEARPPQFGRTKANAIVALADAGVEADVIKDAAVGFGLYKLNSVDAEDIVDGARALSEAA
jgi:hypothetical protein